MRITVSMALERRSSTVFKRVFRWRLLSISAALKKPLRVSYSAKWASS